jgi:hypothetical protein
MQESSFETLLSGGHPNSLGNTELVTSKVLNDKSLLPSLLACYESHDPVVRLRTSSCLKRVCQQQPEWVYEHIHTLFEEISRIDQASTKWTLAIVFGLLRDRFNDNELVAAVKIMKQNLFYPDWIVQNTTMQVLFEFIESDSTIKLWLTKDLESLAESPWKSVAGRATKLLKILGERR